MPAFPPSSLFQANVDPSVDDDERLGFNVGANWYNDATGRIFNCADATSGAAVWRLIGDRPWIANQAEITTVSTSSTTPVALDGMSVVVPSDSYYLVIFSCECLGSATGVEFQLVVDDVAHTTAIREAALGSATAYRIVALNSRARAGANTTIRITFKRIGSTGSASVRRRTLSVLEVL